MRAPAEEALEEDLSRPVAEDIAAMKQFSGDILILGVSGKMGPTLARLALRAAAAANISRRVIGVARFSDSAGRPKLEAHGIETVAADLLDRAAVARLPDAPNVIYLAGQKFGTTSRPAMTWATNVYAAAIAAERFAGSRIVAFSTGNVYPLTPVAGLGPNEDDPVGPIGEYASSALGRERMFEYASARHGTPVVLLRLNYAVEPRYGVVRDLADRIVRGEPIDLAMAFVNVIWQRDANAIALRALRLAASPARILNLTGPKVRIRDIAVRLGEALGRIPQFVGREGDQALLSDPGRCLAEFGPLPTRLERMIDEVARWVLAGGASLNKPTHYDEREGTF